MPPARRPRAIGAVTLLLLVLAVLAAMIGRPAVAHAACTSGSTALILSGGGAKGAWEAGLASVLLGAGRPIALVAGSSAGALNAVMLADGRLDRLEATWRGITREHVYQLRPAIALAGLLPGWLTLATLDRARALFDTQPLRELITATVDFERVRAAPLQLRVVTLDLERRTKRVFDNRTVSVDVLMAATAVPGAFPAVGIEGSLLVDGGLTGRAPVLEALESGASLGCAVVALSYASDERGERPTTIRRALEQAFEASMVHQIERDVELARLKFPRVNVQVVRPSAPLAMRPLEFEAAALGRAFELGQADGRRYLSAGARP
jgi:NTE family protein